MTKPQDNTANPWCLEWSHSQQSFNLARLSEVIKQNYNAMKEGRPSDYILVGMANTSIEILTLGAKYQEIVDQLPTQEET